MLRVLDTKTKTERIVTPKAYSILKKRYKLIEDLGETEAEPIMQPLPNEVPQLQERPKAKVVEPVADEVVEEGTIQVNPEVQSEPVRNKRGPKPKNVNA